MLRIDKRWKRQADKPQKRDDNSGRVEYPACQDRQKAESYASPKKPEFLEINVPNVAKFESAPQQYEGNGCDSMSGYPKHIGS